MGDIGISGMTDLVVPDVDWPGVGVGVGAGAEKARLIVAVGSGEGLSGLTGLVKRGRPREFGVDGDRVGLPSAMSESLLLASMGDGDFTAHVLTVQTGEVILDECERICLDFLFVCSFMQGCFKILRLTGSCTSSGTGSGDVRHIHGQLKISLAKPNGEVFGGVAGVLIAAKPIQFVVDNLRNPILLDAALLADHNYFDTAARIPRVVSNLGGVSGVHISKMTGGDDDTCKAPTSTGSLSLSLSLDNDKYTEVD
ncbi:hypothetical protein FH972_010093 [Carpinus fangiana]|uniref:AT-hook motif nuclear-localized protein n=1 Tax=Carpinus fangiana TaxID=176857 RepID=A0A660KM72_9ROSI|nr:hypothetical protein FH972_010093 [Carpinus fangiana]